VSKFNEIQSTPRQEELPELCIVYDRLVALEERQHVMDGAIEALLVGEELSLTSVANEVEKTNNLALINLTIFEELVRLGVIPEELLRLAAKCLVATRIRMALKLDEEKDVKLAQLLPELADEGSESGEATRKLLKNRLVKLEGEQVSLLNDVKVFLDAKGKLTPTIS